MNDEVPQFTVSSGNVFADLGFDDPEEELAKSDLARQISRIIRKRDWTQTEAARVMGVDQPKISALMRGRLGGFSTDRLMRFLNALDQDVRITVTPKPASQPRARISVDEPGTHGAIAGAGAEDRDVMR